MTTSAPGTPGQPGATPLVGLDSFKAIMSSFPSGVTVVTTMDPDGQPCGTTVSAFISLSADPPLLAVSLAANSHTLAAIKSSGYFATHILAQDNENVARHFAQPGSEFTYAWRPSVHAGGVPVLQSGIAALAECSVDRIVSAGDHDLVIGLIHDGSRYRARPLIYHGRQFSGWVDMREFPFDPAGLAADPLGA
jgi:flavin reductase (DIM6/NTAB) family NADH-FMN oxidoreductase RutF